MKRRESRAHTFRITDKSEAEISREREAEAEDDDDERAMWKAVSATFAASTVMLSRRESSGRRKGIRGTSNTHERQAEGEEEMEEAEEDEQDAYDEQDDDEGDADAAIIVANSSACTLEVADDDDEAVHQQMGNGTRCGQEEGEE